MTNEKTADRFHDLVSHAPDFDLEDFRLIAYGRHFRLSPACKLIVGRDDADNIALAAVASPADSLLYLPDGIPGPLGILRGAPVQEFTSKAASLFARYTKFRNEKSCSVILKSSGDEQTIEALPATDKECAQTRYRQQRKNLERASHETTSFDGQSPDNLALRHRRALFGYCTSLPPLAEGAGKR